MPPKADKKVSSLVLSKPERNRTHRPINMSSPTNNTSNGLNSVELVTNIFELIIPTITIHQYSVEVYENNNNNNVSSKLPVYGLPRAIEVIVEKFIAQQEPRDALSRFYGFNAMKLFVIREFESDSAEVTCEEGITKRVKVKYERRLDHEMVMAYFNGVIKDDPFLHQHAKVLIRLYQGILNHSLGRKFLPANGAFFDQQRSAVGFQARIYETEFGLGVKVHPQTSANISPQLTTSHAEAIGSIFEPANYVLEVQRFAQQVAEQLRDNETGMRLNPNPVSVQGHVLEDPKLPNQSNKLARVAGPSYFSVYSFCPTVDSDAMYAISDKLMDAAKELSLQLTLKVQLINCNPDAPEDEIDFTDAEQIIFIIVPHRKYYLPGTLILECLLHLDRHPLYDVVKHLANQKYGVMTQVMVGEKAIAGKNYYFHKIAREINLKLGGMNVGLKPDYIKPKFMESTMVVGVDVIHRTSVTSNVFRNSIAVVNGSLDPNVSRIYSVVKPQTKTGGANEIVEDISDIIAKLLNVYRNTNCKYPDNLVILRDGVSHALIDYVIQLEELKIKAKLDEVARATGKKINLVMIIVQKRHKTRFVRKEPFLGNVFNVAGGTLVNKVIVNPRYYEFYLNSHDKAPVKVGVYGQQATSINDQFVYSQGTMSSSKYIVLEAGTEHKLDEYVLQKLCNFMCNTTLSANQALSIPGPIHNADRAAKMSDVQFEGRLKFEKQTQAEFVQILESEPNDADRKLAITFAIIPDLAKELYFR